MTSPQEQIEDLASLVVMRLFAKKQKHMISEDDFNFLAQLGASEALGIVAVGHKRQQLQEMVNEELRKAVELTCDRSCGRCKGSGIEGKQGITFIVCSCVNMVHYRGDKVLPLGEQFSNKYFEGELSKIHLGASDTVRNISSAVALFLIGRR